MPGNVLKHREDARTIWQAGLDAVRPEVLLREALAHQNGSLRPALHQARRVLVVGAGKAGAAMSAALEELLPELISKMEGIVNVPAELVRPLRAIRLHAARPAGTNEPTREGVEGAEQIIKLLGGAGPDDAAVCLLSGGGSALLPAPAEGISLDDKQQVTRLLHACGATINEMNCVRKHLSQTKGGRLAQAFKGRTLFSLIISDVIGDPLDVIASGPTAADPTTFFDAFEVLKKYQLEGRVPHSIVNCLKRGMQGDIPETLKQLPRHVHNQVIGNNARALQAAEKTAERLGYRVLNLGSFLEGETRQVALVHAGILRSIRSNGLPLTPPACLLSGGETTVTLGNFPGKGGRNQEFVLASLVKLAQAGSATARGTGQISPLSSVIGGEGLQDLPAHTPEVSSAMEDVIILSGGTDGEDGPTDAAGAIADARTLERAHSLGLEPGDFLARHDAYTFFAATGDLLKTGLTQTNVMDVRVLLVL
ncbi:MAG: glycerate kinase [Gemmataceae bacterium]